jgi:eukaryotic-like serine/threonine-protein kinase
MKPERWQQIDELLQSALARTLEERPAFLAQVCAGDEPLRREVESLIASHEQAENFLEAPLSQVAAELLVRDHPSLAKSQRFGSYQIAVLLGKGGMGEVYLAEDTRLGRKVALKLLPAYFTKDEDRLRRFEQEARAASALNHPNILTIYEIGQLDGHQFIATEFIDGVTLRRHMAGSPSLTAHEGTSAMRTPMKLGEVLDIAAQVAAALAAAHAAGIVHRDVKPENVMVRSDGYVKVVDFGLAKLTEHKVISTSAEAPTRMLVNTSPGLVMGTVQYMSPEQARGLAVDARTDIWSLGVVLYEMLTGKVPFEGETPSHVIVSILEEEPLPLPSHVIGVPAELDRIVNKALRKNRDERYQTVKDLAFDLKSLKQELEIADRLDLSIEPDPRAGIAKKWSGKTAIETAQTPRLGTGDVGIGHSTSSVDYPVSELLKSPAWRSAILLILLVTVVAVVFIAFRPSKAPSPTPRIRPFTSYPGNENNPSFSPDGNQIAFVWDGATGDNYDIYVKLIDAGTPLRLTTNPATDSYPAWSPDGRYIAFVRSSETGAGIYLIPALGGAERKLAEKHASKHFLGTRLSWSPDGKFIAISDYLSPEDPTSIFLLAVDTGEMSRVTSPPTGSVGDFFPAISPDGSSVAFARASGWGIEDIYITPVAGGEARRLTFDKTFTGGIAWTPDSREIVFASARRESGSLNLWKISISGGQPERLEIAGQIVLNPAISRRGDRLAYGQVISDVNIWRIDLSSSDHASAPLKSIASTQYEKSPRYSPDGKRIAFESDRSGSWEIWVSDGDGANPVQLTSMGGPLTGFPRWSPDGKLITFYSQGEGNSDIFLISAEGGKPRRLTVESSEEMASSWSRDGRWIYFGSNRSGEWQIWKMPAEGGEAVPVTKQGGFDAIESFDGKHIYYTKGNDIVGIWRVPVDGGEEELVVDAYKAGYLDYWALVEDGIYFATDRTPLPSVQFLSFGTGQISEIAKLEKEKAPLRGAEAGLSVSPDKRWIIYTQKDLRGSDIMLMEDFR